MDSIQQSLTDYALGLRFEALAPPAVNAAKVRLLDMLGAAMAGFPTAPSGIARDTAKRMPQSDGASVIGTRIMTSPDMAAFVNGMMVRQSSQMNGDDIAAPVLAAAEHVHAQGRGLIVALALADEVCRRLAAAMPVPAPLASSNVGCIASALAAGYLLGLSREQLAQCVSLAAVPNVILDAQEGAWRGLAAGASGRDGVFAALAARQGMEGPVMPFEGKTGWCALVAGGRFTLDRLGKDSGAPMAVDIADAEARFLAHAGALLGPERARAVVEHVRGLEKLDDVSAFAGAMVVA